MEIILSIRSIDIIENICLYITSFCRWQERMILFWDVPHVMVFRKNQKDLSGKIYDIDNMVHGAGELILLSYIFVKFYEK